MSQTSPTSRFLPRVGMRNIKTATAAALCALVYFFLNRSPAFACIGAIFGMGSDLENSKPATVSSAPLSAACWAWRSSGST